MRITLKLSRTLPCACDAVKICVSHITLNWLYSSRNRFIKYHVKLFGNYSVKETEALGPFKLRWFLVGYYHLKWKKALYFFISVPEDSRCIAETHYQLGVALGFNAQFDEAVNALSDAIAVLEKRISFLKEGKASAGKLAYLFQRRFLQDVFTFYIFFSTEFIWILQKNLVPPILLLEANHS